MFRITKEEKAVMKSRKINYLKCLMKTVNGFDTDSEKNIDCGEIWCQGTTIMVSDQGGYLFEIFHPLAFFIDDNVKHLKQYCSWRLLLFVHPTLYRSLKLTPPDILEVCLLMVLSRVR